MNVGWFNRSNPALVTGRAEGQPSPWNPLAWIPVLIAIPFLLSFMAAFYGALILFLPALYLWNRLSSISLTRKRGVISERGVHFTKAYRQRTIPWSEIREVVRERDGKTEYYRIVCNSSGAHSGEQPQEYLLSATPDNEAFERTLDEYGITFRVPGRSWS